MSKRAIKGLVAATLIGAASILGCADIINANFDRDVVGGAGGSAESGSTTSTGLITGAVTATSTGAGGSEPNDICMKTTEETVQISVFVKPSTDETQADDFIATRHKFLPDTPGFSNASIGGFTLYTSKANLTSPRLLSDCPVSNNGHTIKEGFVTGCECLGFAEYSKMGEGLLGNHRQLTKLTGHNGDAFLALDLAKAADIAATCKKYSKDKQCEPSYYYGPK